MSENRWRVHQRRHPDLLEHLCLLRGFKSQDLMPDFELHLHDPFLLPNIAGACRLIEEAITNKWHVTIFGDYDADGTPASAILSLMLSQLGVAHEVVLPTRHTGYGLRPDQVRLVAERSNLLITVDTGISSVEEIQLAKELGLKVIILDHHLPGSSLPPADAVVDPHLPESQYPFPHLCGCALAYKLVVALGRTHPSLSDRFSKWLLDLVAISTVADMMPLLGENRALVHYGLIVLRQNRRRGIRALLAQAGLDANLLDARSLGFILGPRLNAAGRLGDNAPAYELLKADSDESADALAADIEAANTARQALVAKVMVEADELLFEQNNSSDSVYLIAKEGWPSGVVGLVAGKIAAKYARPVLVATFEAGVARGSARSIDAYPMVTALSGQAPLLTTYGGHAAAAGFSLPEKNWLSFAQNLKKTAATVLTPELLTHTYLVDAELEQNDVNRRSIDALTKLQPYGLGNGRPLFLLRQAKLTDIRRIGRSNQHLKSRLITPNHQLESIAFGLADRLGTAPPNLDCIGHLEVNRWNNRETLQFQIIDYRPSSDTFDWITNG